MVWSVPLRNNLCPVTFFFYVKRIFYANDINLFHVTDNACLECLFYELTAPFGTKLLLVIFKTKSPLPDVNNHFLITY